MGGKDVMQMINAIEIECGIWIARKTISPWMH